MKPRIRGRKRSVPQREGTAHSGPLRSRSSHKDQERREVHVPEPTKSIPPVNIQMKSLTVHALTTACSDSSALYTSGRTCSRKAALSHFPCNNSRLSRSVIIFCGGSLTAKSGFNDGRTCNANCEGERLVEIANTLGRIDGSRCGSFICNRIRPWRWSKDKRSGPPLRVNLVGSSAPASLLRTDPVHWRDPS